MSIPLTVVSDAEFRSKMEADPQALATAVPAGVTRRERMPIAEMPGGFRLAADVYYREQRPARPRPALVFLHDWAGGKQPELCGNRQGSWFAIEANLFVAVLYYRQPSEARFPAALQDLKCALRWLRAVAGDYAIDPDRLVAMGSSAGTQWAFLAAASNGTGDDDGVGGYEGYSSDVNLAVINAGMCDLVKDFGHHPNAIAIMGGSVDEIPARFREGSPLHRFRAGMPPVLMIHGELDKACPLASSQAALARLRELGVTAELVVRPGCGHGLDGFGYNLGSHLNEALRFIRRVWPDAIP